MKREPDPNYRMPRWKSRLYDLRHRAGQVLLVVVAALALVGGALLMILAATS